MGQAEHRVARHSRALCRSSELQPTGPLEQACCLAMGAQIGEGRIPCGRVLEVSSTTHCMWVVKYENQSECGDVVRRGRHM